MGQCGDCLCFVRGEGPEGECRVGPPQQLLSTAGGPAWGWPRTPENGWCYLHKPVPKERKTGKRLDMVQINLRVEAVWEVHLRARARYYELEGLAPQEPAFTTEIRDAIRAGLVEHDSAWLGGGQVDEWKAKSYVRAAGIGLFLSPFHCGQNDDGRRYLEAWRAWKKRRGEPDPVTTFADLYFRKKAGEK